MMNGLKEYISCPSCARQGFDVIKTVAALEDRLAHITTSMSLSIIGCVVNGPGESKAASIGISLPGTGEAPAAPVFIDGEKALTLRGEGIAQEFHRIVEDLLNLRIDGVEFRVRGVEIVLGVLGAQRRLAVAVGVVDLYF